MALSRYRNVNIIKEKSLPQFFETVDLPSSESLELVPSFKIRVAQFDRLDQLAFKHLGGGEYWWVIAIMNDIDWMYKFEPGQILRIPENVDDVLKLI